ncbi:MAG TPA: hypothetical protein PJ991_08150 [Kiritimatiellia bacterium]|nr:hypothetical protein [Kiritimatiellia bacterium]
MIWLIFVSLYFSSWTAFALHPDFKLEKRGSLYHLDARNVALADILDRLNDMEGGKLKTFGNTGERVHVVVSGVTLETLLDRLRVSFVLVYESHDEQNYRLSEAMLMDSDAESVEPTFLARIRNWVSDLRDDDIEYNAGNALYHLSMAGCDAVNPLEQALYDQDLQLRYTSAKLLWTICTNYVFSDRLLDVTIDLMSVQEDVRGMFTLASPFQAYYWIRDMPEVYERARNRLVHNLNSGNPQEKLLSALLLAEYGEKQLAYSLVRVLAPHLADNDLKGDGALATYALARLGSVAVPHLKPYRDSKDVQQSELADLIIRTIESGENHDLTFNSVMYAGYTKNPATEKPYPYIDLWQSKDFPNSDGIYENLSGYRITAAEIYQIHSPDYMIHSSTGQNADESEQPFTFVIKGRETFKSVAMKFAVPEDELRRLNEMSDLHPDSILPEGLRILIPYP